MQDWKKKKKLSTLCIDRKPKKKQSKQINFSTLQYIELDWNTVWISVFFGCSLECNKGSPNTAYSKLEYQFIWIYYKQLVRAWDFLVSNLLWNFFPDAKQKISRKTVIYKDSGCAKLHPYPISYPSKTNG